MLTDVNMQLFREGVLKIVRAYKTKYEEGGKVGKRFPYKDCFKLIAEDEDTFEGLIPDLDMYISEIAGYCSWEDQILDWTLEKLGQAHWYLHKSFFERHPVYAPLQMKISEEYTPALSRRLKTYETVRVDMGSLLNEFLLASTPLPDWASLFGEKAGQGHTDTAAAELATYAGIWEKASFETTEENWAYHFGEHGVEMEAQDLLQYLRKAVAFAQDLSEAQRKLVENGIRYEKAEKFIIIDFAVKIWAFGKL